MTNIRLELPRKGNCKEFSSAVDKKNGIELERERSREIPLLVSFHRHSRADIRRRREEAY